MSADCHVFHGDIPQDKRELVLQKFREGKYHTLLTTNVAARGLDVPSVDLVIQCHPPKDADDYVHRSGRTGRADRSGVSVCFYNTREKDRLLFIEKKTGVVFRRISPPTVEDIAKVWSQEIEESFKSIPKATWSTFKPIAESIVLSLTTSKTVDNSLDEDGDDCNENKSKKQLKSKGLLRALCCALARLSGKDGQIDARSALTAQKGVTAYKLDLHHEAHRKGLAYAITRRHLPEEVVNSIKSLSFIKGKLGFVFDLPSEHDELMKTAWPESEPNKLSLLTEIPELEPEYSDNQSYFAGGGRSFDLRGGGRGRSQNNWSRGRGRGMKRSFNDRDSSYTSRSSKWSKSS